jgi:hypothetical protein
MTKATVGQWVTAATNIAVLVGVLLVAYELKQNAELARLEMTQTRISANQQAEAAFFDPQVSEVWVKSFTEPETMTLAEIRAMDSYLAIHLNQMMRVHAQEREGLVEKGETLKWMKADFPFLFGSRFAQAWWEEFGQNWPSDFVELARPVVESVEDDELSKKFGRLQERLAIE